MTTTDDRIRALFPNIGNTYYVDAQNGSDAAGRGDHDNPLKTIQYAIDNYVVADRGDVVICCAPGNSTYDENTDDYGLLINKAGTKVVGIDMPRIKNSQVAAYSICRIMARDCGIMGFRIGMGGNAVQAGVWLDADYAMVGSEKFPNAFGSDCTGAINTNSGDYAKITHNDIYCRIGMKINSYCLVRHNRLTGDAVGGNYGVFVSGARNTVLENDISHYATGIWVAAGAKKNTIIKNALNCYNTDCAGTNVLEGNNKTCRYNLISGNLVGPLWFSGVKRIPGNVLTTTLYDETTSGIPYKDNVSRTWWISFTPSRLFSSGTHTATITFKEYSDTGTYIGKNEQTIPVGTQCPVGAPSNTVFFTSKNTIKIDITLDGLTGSDVDVTVIASADTVG